MALASSASPKWPLQPHQTDTIRNMQWLERRGRFVASDAAMNVTWELALPVGVLADPTGTGLSWSIVMFLVEEEESRRASSSIVEPSLAFWQHPWVREARVLSSPWTAAAIEAPSLLIAPLRVLRSYQKLLRETALRVGVVDASWWGEFSDDQWRARVAEFDVLLCAADLADRMFHQCPALCYRRILVERARPKFCFDLSPSGGSGAEYVRTVSHFHFLWLIHSRDDAPATGSLPSMLQRLPEAILREITVQTDPRRLEQSLNMPFTVRDSFWYGRPGQLVRDTGTAPFAGSLPEAIVHLARHVCTERAICLVDESDLPIIDCHAGQSGCAQLLSLRQARSLMSSSSWTWPSQMTLLLTPTCLADDHLAHMDMPLESVHVILNALRRTKSSNRDFAEELHRRCLRIGRTKSLQLIRVQEAPTTTDACFVTPGGRVARMYFAPTPNALELGSPPPTSSSSSATSSGPFERDSTNHL